MEKDYVCPRCGNKDPRFVGHKNGLPYCRRCIAFQGQEAQRKPCEEKNVELDLSYSLSREQKALSDKALANFIEGKDTLIYAVCGSGKTEISYGVIGYAMSKGLRVGFALPRRDVVIELYVRLKHAFPHQSIVAVYGGHNENLEGDCLVLTTHQLYRYPQYFDLLVMDEIDAFPFKGDETLIALFQRSLKGHCLMMSATPSKEIVKEFKQPGKEMLCLHTRFHKHPIPVPKTEQVFGFLQPFWIAKRLKQYQQKRLPCFIFVPSVEQSKDLFEKLNLFVKGGNYVSSKRVERETIIQRFKEGKYLYLVTTAVLERGITVKNLQVIVARADSSIYDAASLIQIAGRAGRKADAPDGEVTFLCEKETDGIKGAIREIKHCNTYL